MPLFEIRCASSCLVMPLLSPGPIRMQIKDAGGTLRPASNNRQGQVTESLKSNRDGKRRRSRTRHCRHRCSHQRPVPCPHPPSAGRWQQPSRLPSSRLLPASWAQQSPGAAPRRWSRHGHGQGRHRYAGRRQRGRSSRVPRVPGAAGRPEPAADTSAVGPPRRSTCYGHLAGHLGISVTEEMARRGNLLNEEGSLL